jgi:8-amino-7-oxononanoate synthase
LEKLVEKEQEGASMKDIFEKCYKYTTAREAMATGFYPYFHPLSENEGTEAIFQGRRVIMCGSNNYLGLTTHPRVRQAAIDAIQRFGTSCTGSRFVNGTLDLHVQLEQELAEFVGKQAALVFTTGMQVNLGTISSLVGRGEYVILDKEDHASIVDGAKLSWGETKRFHHNDLESLERLLEKLPEDKGRLVVVDGLYSMGGDLAPLPEIIQICQKYGARLMVDDAHSTGVFGGGKGTSAHFGVTDQVDLIMSTFSKSFASVGGFLAGDEDIIHFVKHNARALIFSASVSPANAAAALEALHIMRTEPEHAQRALANGEYMRQGMRRIGLDIGESVSPIVPIMIRDDMKTLVAWKLLIDAGVFTNPVISPAVPQGSQLLRTSYMATHTKDQLDRVLEMYASVGKQIGLI